MPQPLKQSEPQVTWRVFAGDRKAIRQQIAAEDIPPQWGDREVVSAYILNQIPLDGTWRGSVRVTGYRTPVNDQGTGTAYVSVHWEPER